MRTRGAVSHSWITLEALNNHFQPAALIPISRRWAMQNNLTEAKSVAMNEETIQASGNQPLVQEIIQVNEIT